MPGLFVFKDQPHTATAIKLIASDIPGESERLGRLLQSNVDE